MVYFIKHKSEVLDKFKEFESITTNDSGLGIRLVGWEQIMVGSIFHMNLKSI